MFDDLENKAIQEIKDYALKTRGILITDELAQEILKQSIDKISAHYINGTSKISNPKGILGNFEKGKLSI